MRAPDLLPADRVLILRRAFDRSFAGTSEHREEEAEVLLAIRIGPDAYAVRLSEVAGLFTDRRVTPIPGAESSLLGISGFRGTLIPVYDLRVLLGYPGPGVPRWLITTLGAPAALAFDAFDGQLRCQRTALVQQRDFDGSRPHVQEVVRAADLVRPILRLDSILEVIRARVHSSAPGKER